jgi:hypothetical protein
MGLGRFDPVRGAPDVDLWPDARVSRSHARIWSEGGAWWIEDTSSRSGTLVDGQEIRGCGPARLEPGCEIRLGGTALLLAAPTWRRVRTGDLVVDLELTPALNLALAHCGLPIVSRLTVRNWSMARTSPGRLTLTLPHVGEAAISVPALAPGEALAVGRPDVTLDYTSLEGQVERTRVSAVLKLDGRPLAGDRLECWMLAHNEWSSAVEHRLSLAAFVLPNHPLVTETSLEIARAEPAVEPARTLQALYAQFADGWQLAYRLEPPHWGSASQKIRLPHQVLRQAEHRTGEGTCIDLALLFAGCLEHLGPQPLLAIVEMEGWRHALVGCWERDEVALEPLLLNRERLLNEAIWVDPTGCTRDPDCRLPFDAARVAAVSLLGERPLAFALDLTAARAEEITPLPFAGEPRWSEPASAALEAARVYARQAGAPLGTVPLMLGLLDLESGLTRQLVDARLGRADRARPRLAAGLPPSPNAQPSRSYTRVLALARSEAKLEGSPLVLESHVLSALLETPSDRLDRALLREGTTRAELRTLLNAIRNPDSAGSFTYSVLPEFTSGP